MIAKKNILQLLDTDFYQPLQIVLS